LRRTIRKAILFWMVPLRIAARITLDIISHAPVFILALLPAAYFEVITELVTKDEFYYQQHRWCPFVGCVLSGSLIFLARRIPLLEAGVWLGPLFFVLGTFILLRG